MNISNRGRVPDWDLEQLEVIMEDPAVWQVVVAGPGTGKSAVACQRVAFLVDEGVPSSRILVVSFTRTAVAELRDRIVSYAVAGDQARSVRISTIDSHAWSLRIGFDDEPLQNVFGDDSYELSIERVVELFRSKSPMLLEFTQSLQHLIIDEAQDIVGIRAQLVLEILRGLSDKCGVTILTDPVQAIYGFTTDEQEVDNRSRSLLELLQSDGSRTVRLKRLERIHRIQNPKLIDVFERTRREVERQKCPIGYLERVHDTIRDASGQDVGPIAYEIIAGLLGSPSDGSTLALFRRRAEVLIASSFCSKVQVEHQLRMSGTPIVVSPWIGWLFGECTDSIIDREAFGHLWRHRAERAVAPFEGHKCDKSWNLLHRVAAGRRPGTLDLTELRRVVARTRPPVELCLPDCGMSGPILGTIHASKGREADTVLLVMPPSQSHEFDEEGPDAVLEEGRVYYVGATRARKILIVGANKSAPVSYLNSKRVFRRLAGNRIQLEVGREGDVDVLAHLSWTNSLDIQLALASCVGRTVPLKTRTIPEVDYALRLVLEQKGSDGVTRCADIGEMSQGFQHELWQLSNILDADGGLKPPTAIPHLYLLAVTTIGLTEDQRAAIKAPFCWSGLALGAVVKGFPTLQFPFRRTHRNIR